MANEVSQLSILEQATLEQVASNCVMSDDTLQGVIDLQDIGKRNQILSIAGNLTLNEANKVHSEYRGNLEWIMGVHPQMKLNRERIIERVIRLYELADNYEAMIRLGLNEERVPSTQRPSQVNPYLIFQKAFEIAIKKGEGIAITIENYKDYLRRNISSFSYDNVFNIMQKMLESCERIGSIEGIKAIGKYFLEEGELEKAMAIYQKAEIDPIKDIREIATGFITIIREQGFIRDWNEYDWCGGIKWVNKGNSRYLDLALEYFKQVGDKARLSEIGSRYCNGSINHRGPHTIDYKKALEAYIAAGDKNGANTIAKKAYPTAPKIAIAAYVYTENVEELERIKTENMDPAVVGDAVAGLTDLYAKITGPNEPLVKLMKMVK